MKLERRTIKWATAAAALAVAAAVAVPALAAAVKPAGTRPDPVAMRLHKVTNAQRQAAAKTLAAVTTNGNVLGKLFGARSTLQATLTPNATPNYYGVANYANSPLPELDASGNVIPGTGIRKFVDSLPGLGAAAANDLGQYIPVATANTTAYPGSDYYVIALVEYHEQLHKDLPPTTLRGYVQLSSNDSTTELAPPSYLGPTIIANKDVPVRVKFINKLPTGNGGNLFLPVDTSIMGAGMGPNGGNYTQNRATLHLHGGATPWISDGTPHQWTTPANEATPYQEGVSVKNVPDMNGGVEPTGTLTFYYTNQQSARLMFYHDHSFGITRLNVYAGEAAPYVLRDDVEKALVNGGQFKKSDGTTYTATASTIPTDEIPLVIQDKTFVPKDSQLASEDPTWDKARWGGEGNLWLPHVYMPNQINGNDFFNNELGGVNAYGRWDYNPWFYPPIVALPGGGSFGTPVANPLFGQVGQPAQNPGMPSPTITPESFMDTPLVNGTAYPYLKVGHKAYRFRILNASNDRTLNLQIYFAKSNTPASSDASGNPTLQTASGEVSMTPAAVHPNDPNWPSTWPTDGRDGGVPDPSVVGPSMIQIGNEGGLIPSATVLPNTPIGYEYFRRTITVLNVTNHTLLLAPAERADVIVDFSQVPPGSKLIMYNDAPAPMPAFDSRLDYYTGDPDQTTSGGAPSTIAGYGPNTRTVMQFQVANDATTTAFNLPLLRTALQAAYGATQPKPIVPEAAYGPAFGTTYRDNYVHTTDTTMTFLPASQSSSVTIGFEEKAIIEGFDQDWGRMNANLGGTLPNLGPAAGTATPYDYADPPTDITTNTIPGTQIGALRDGTQIWRIDHQGVDTHSIHFHLMNVQLINRIAIDGQLFYPDANELGWKETIRMNPGQDVIIAIRPMAPTLPWKLPDSVRPLNPALPVGATFVDQLGTTVTNVMTNFGWEYVWHCHLLGHEENDMMRPFVFEAAPAASTALTAVTGNSPLHVTLSWANHWNNPLATNILVQRSTNAAFTSAVTTFSAAGTATTYNDTGVAANTTYYYRIRAESAVGYSDWTNVVTIKTGLPIPWLTKTGSNNVYLIRHNGSAPWTFGATLRVSSAGAALPGRILELQRSANGTTWTRSAQLITNSAGAVSVTISFTTAGTSYWRWVFKGDATYAPTLTSTTRVRVL
jgi:FtsP/CotA-like multicopper oxidase with cupredoxin domain